MRGAFFLGAGLVLVQPCAGASGVFEDTGSLGTARERFTATLLPNGKVLVAGGLDNTGTPLASAELYDPASGTWTPTGSLGTARDRHGAILLPNGKVLVAGGLDNTGNPIASAELYDPASGTWTPTGSLGAAGSHSTATLLPNGQVLAAGGLDNTGTPIASAELYDPASGTWTPTGSLGTARDRQTATLLPSGMVLVAGGLGITGNALASAELYDPVSGTWTPTGNLRTARDRFGAILLPNGNVLIGGGLDNTGATLASAELYDPASGTWTPTGSLGTARNSATVTLLPNGQVLVAGGLDNTGTSLASAELYDPASGTWTPTGNLNTARDHHTATLLPDGKTLVAGGLDSTGVPLASAELYDLGPPVITSPLVATGAIDLAFVYQFEASGATSLGVTDTDLPGGLIFDPVLSAITGQPGQTGTFQVGLSASNASGTTNATLVITIQPAPTSGPVIMSSTSAKGRTGLPFSFQVITSGSSSLARLTATGLPPGLSVDPVTGLISGIAPTDGSSAVTLTVTDGNQTTTSSLQLSFSSDLALPVIISPSTAALLIGQPFGYTIMAPSSDSSDVTSYVLLGQLPAGLGFDAADGIISDTFPGRLGNVPGPKLSGGIVTNVQLFATNSHGTGTIPLVFLQTPTGAINISTRLDVGTGADVLIGGFIVTGNAPKRVLIRAIGPSLPVAGTLGPDPRVTRQQWDYSAPMTTGATRRNRRLSTPLSRQPTTWNQPSWPRWHPLTPLSRAAGPTP